MSTSDFIPYPTNRLVGTIENPNDARAAIDALSEAGFAPEAIEVLHGEDGLHRLDPTGQEHGFLARFQRTLIRLGAPVEEYKHLRGHVADVRAGRFVLMVLAKEPARREVASGILRTHGATSIGFFGTWAYEGLDAGPSGRSDQS